MHTFPTALLDNYLRIIKCLKNTWPLGRNRNYAGSSNCWTELCVCLRSSEVANGRRLLRICTLSGGKGKTISIGTNDQALPREYLHPHKVSKLWKVPRINSRRTTIFHNLYELAIDDCIQRIRDQSLVVGLLTWRAPLNLDLHTWNIVSEQILISYKRFQCLRVLLNHPPTIALSGTLSLSKHLILRQGDIKWSSTAVPGFSGAPLATNSHAYYSLTLLIASDLLLCFWHNFFKLVMSADVDHWPFKRFHNGPWSLIVGFREEIQFTCSLSE